MSIKEIPILLIILILLKKDKKSGKQNWIRNWKRISHYGGLGFRRRGGRGGGMSW